MTLLHPDIPSKGDDAIARVAAQAITREVDVTHTVVGLGSIIVMATLLILAGVLWTADARDDVRATRRAVEKCR